eukprot:6858005-Alexandrium_andersonii.AAC.2
MRSLAGLLARPRGTPGSLRSARLLRGRLRVLPANDPDLLDRLVAPGRPSGAMNDCERRVGGEAAVGSGAGPRARARGAGAAARRLAPGLARSPASVPCGAPGSCNAADWLGLARLIARRGRPLHFFFGWPPQERWRRGDGAVVAGDPAAASPRAGAELAFASPLPAATAAGALSC